MMSSLTQAPIRAGFIFCAILVFIACSSEPPPPPPPSLHGPAKTGDVSKLEEGIRAGGDLNAPGQDGMRPLHWAPVGANPEVVRVLLSHGAIADATDRYGRTPLHLASSWGRMDMVRQLIEKGVDLNQSDKYGHTAFHKACLNCQIDTAILLIESGANPDMLTWEDEGWEELASDTALGMRDIIGEATRANFVNRFNEFLVQYHGEEIASATD